MLALNNHDLFRALGDIDEALLEDRAELSRKKKPIPYGRYVTVAVAACLCVAALFLSPMLLSHGETRDAAGTNKTASANPSSEETSNLSDEARTQSPTLTGGPQTSTDAAMPGAVSPQAVDGTGPSPGGSLSMPSDFEFTLIWEENVYRSADLSPEQLQHAWTLLSGLPTSSTEIHGDIRLTMTANNATGFVVADKNISSREFLTCKEIRTIFEANHTPAQSVR